MIRFGILLALLLWLSLSLLLWLLIFHLIACLAATVAIFAVWRMRRRRSTLARPR